MRNAQPPDCQALSDECRASDASQRCATSPSARTNPSPRAPQLSNVPREFTPDRETACVLSQITLRSLQMRADTAFSGGGNFGSR